MGSLILCHKKRAKRPIEISRVPYKDQYTRRVVLLYLQ